MTVSQELKFDRLVGIGHDTALRLGVIGAARIAPKALSAALDEDDFCVQVTAIAARSKQRADAMGAALSVSKRYGSYEQLCNDDEVDAVYVCTPCSEHAALAKMALRKGKHVLCEKPFSLSLAEARSVLDVACVERRLVMEAHHWRFHPLLESVAASIARLGSIHRIESFFAGGIDSPDDIRKNPLLGAGVTMDFGCYALQWVSWVATQARGKPLADAVVEILGAKMREETKGVDVTLDARLLVEGIPTTICCDMRAGTKFAAPLRVVGEYGVVTFETPLVAERSSVVFEPNRIGARNGLKRQENAPFRRTTTYRDQLLAFFDALRTGHSPANSGREILFTQSLLDRMYEVAGLPSRTELRQSALSTARC